MVTFFNSFFCVRKFNEIKKNRQIVGSTIFSVRKENGTQEKKQTEHILLPYVEQDWLKFQVWVKQATLALLCEKNTNL